jgi:ribonuclease D
VMKRFENPNYSYLKSNEELISYLEDLEDKKCRIIALDTEAELNLHAYGEKLCLIQIFDGTNKVLIDPFEIDNISLKTLFESRNILKIIYDASSDSSLLKNTYNIDIKSVLDLRPAVEILNFDKQDLHSVITLELGVTLTKKMKFQRYNWTKRPIDKEAIDYAINDVIYLFKLKDALYKKLYTKNLLDVFILKNLRVQNKDYTRNPRERHHNIKGYHSLSNDEKRIFKRVFDVRDKYAKMCNIPSYSVINKIDLIDIAKGVKYINELKFPKRFSESLIQVILNELKSAVE